MNSNLPNYLDQTEAVKNRFDKLKQREVILEVKHLGKVYKTAKGEMCIRDRHNTLCINLPSAISRDCATQ